MGRALPVSILLHLLGLWLVAVYGGHVPQPPLEPQRVLRVQIARLPEVVEPQVTQPAPEPEPSPAVPSAEPEPAPETQRPEPELPPKQVPEPEVREPEPRPEPEPEPEPTPPVPEPEPEPADPLPEPEEAPPTPPASGPAVRGTDVDFPFAWYLNRVEGIVARNWNPRQLGFRSGSQRRCVVHFRISRAGQITGATIVQSSGVRLFDREALRAVQAGRLPPLPAKFPHPALGVTFVFTLESGI
jgi:TonB family protein